MAQLLWFAINSGLRNESFLKRISDVKEPLVNMLDEIIQVNCGNSKKIEGPLQNETAKTKLSFTSVIVPVINV